MAGENDNQREKTPFFYKDEHGQAHDASLHESLLDNPEMDRAIALRSMKLAISKGLSEASAVALYATDEIREGYEETGELPPLDE